MTRIEHPTRHTGSHVATAQARTIYGGAVIVAAILGVAGAALAAAALLPLAALALLGAGSAGVAAVREQSWRPLGWVVTVLTIGGLLAVTIDSIIARP
jgi:hypothetical protein